MKESSSRLRTFPLSARGAECTAHIAKSTCENLVFIAIAKPIMMLRNISGEVSHTVGQTMKVVSEPDCSVHVSEMVLGKPQCCIHTGVHLIE